MEALLPALDDMTWQEFALDDEAILCDIPSESSASLRSSDPDHVSCEYPTLMGLSPLSTPPETPVSANPAIPSFPVGTPSKRRQSDPGLPSEAIKNKKVILMQSIISAEDDLVKALRSALSLCDPSECRDLQCHISPSIEEQLSGRYNLPRLIAHADKENVALSTSTPSPPKRLRMLPSLELQKKEKRHQSFGIR